MANITMNYAEAVADALKLEMRRDPDVYVYGEDVGKFGGSFGVTGYGVFEEFPDRVLDTPISETAIVGTAVGAAAAGMRPCVEILFMDFLPIAMDELCNQAAKFHYMFGGQMKCPMVVRTALGAGMGAAAHHSQSLEAMLCHIPGLKTVIPATPYDAKGLLISSIRDDNPVAFLEHKMLYSLKGEVPEGDYTVPIGKADLKREGTDVTLVCYSSMVHRCLEAADGLEKDGVHAEVLDLRTLIPMDKDAILNSLAKTHRLVIVHEACLTGGFGGEIAAIAAGEGFDLLDAPIVRVAGPDTPVPFSPALEAEFLVNAPRIIAAVRGLLG
ncbi:MAG: alpha-ketoacid dehydrogenase subunit beta [Acidobacteria bacterium]|nr:alpha-ketoacid dehydrogenase subunit beta [Acidobacteriota bacterium]